jgi:hypothetical protein
MRNTCYNIWLAAHFCWVVKAVFLIYNIWPVNRLVVTCVIYIMFQAIFNWSYSTEPIRVTVRLETGIISGLSHVGIAGSNISDGTDISRCSLYFAVGINMFCYNWHWSIIISKELNHCSKDSFCRIDSVSKLVTKPKFLEYVKHVSQLQV